MREGVEKSTYRVVYIVLVYIAVNGSSQLVWRVIHVHSVLYSALVDQCHHYEKVE